LPATSKPPRLRDGLKDVSREQFAAAVSERLGKQRVSIMLDGAIIAFFKAKAGERGYQTLINPALHQAMTGEQPLRVIHPLHLLHSKIGNLTSAQRRAAEEFPGEVLAADPRCRSAALSLSGQPP